jgi:hypothetical protein
MDGNAGSLLAATMPPKLPFPSLPDTGPVIGAEIVGLLECCSNADSVIPLDPPPPGIGRETLLNLEPSDCDAKDKLELACDNRSRTALNVGPFHAGLNLAAPTGSLLYSRTSRKLRVLLPSLRDPLMVDLDPLIVDGAEVELGLELCAYVAFLARSRAFASAIC